MSKNPQRPVAPPLIVHRGRHAWRWQEKDRFLEDYLLSTRKWRARITQMTLHPPNPFSSLAFLRGGSECGEDGGLWEFSGTWFQTFDLLSSMEIKDKTLHEIFISLIPISPQRMTTETRHRWIIPQEREELPDRTIDISWKISYFKNTFVIRGRKKLIHLWIIKWKTCTF